MSSRQHSSSQTHFGIAGVSAKARAQARERSNANLRHGRGNRFMKNMTVSMSTIPEIDAVRLSTPTVTHFKGRRCIGIAPGDRFVRILCGLDFKSSTQHDLHHPTCTGCPNPNQFEGDGVCHTTIKHVVNHLAGRDHQRNSGQTPKSSKCHNW